MFQVAPTGIGKMTSVGGDWAQMGGIGNGFPFEWCKGLIPPVITHAKERWKSKPEERGRRSEECGWKKSGWMIESRRNKCHVQRGWSRC